MNERIKLLADHAKAYANQCTKDIDGDVSWHWNIENQSATKLEFK